MRDQVEQNTLFQSITISLIIFITKFIEIMENDMSDFLQIDQLNEGLLFDLSMTAETNIDGSGESKSVRKRKSSIVFVF